MPKNIVAAGVEMAKEAAESTRCLPWPPESGLLQEPGLVCPDGSDRDQHWHDCLGSHPAQITDRQRPDGSVAPRQVPECFRVRQAWL
jgi:hypothetical protein